jgi:hypothetical protein
MAIRDWHPGQLVIVWIVIVAIDWALYQFFMTASLPQNRSDTYYTLVNVGAMLVLAIPPLLGLVWTWKWLDARKA